MLIRRTQDKGVRMPTLQPMVVVPQESHGFLDCNCLVSGRSPLLLFCKQQAVSVTFHFA